MSQILSNFIFKKALVIGLGLVGGSLAKALKKSQTCEKIFACDLDEESLDLAKDEGVIFGASSNLEFFADEIPSFDLIIISTPLESYEEIFAEIGTKISSNSLVIDLGSVKNLNLKNLPKNFVPCHPIAGSANTGFEHSQADLFAEKKFIICAKDYDKRLDEIIAKIGAKKEILDAKKHDEIYALVSHLPQFLSFLTKEFSPKKIDDEFFKTAFRLDDSSPELWEDIFELNEENLEKFYLQFFDNLEKNIKNLPKLENKGAKAAPTFNEKFFEENFPAIFFRALVAKSLLEIAEIKTYQNYAGQGFVDFTSITEIFNFDAAKLNNLLAKNQSKIRKFFESIS